MDRQRTGFGGGGGIFKTVYTDQNTPVELKPPLGGRSYLFIQNNSSGRVYYSEDTQANSENGIVLEAGQYLELSSNLGNAVPQGHVWILGASVSRQRVQVKEG